MNPKDEVKFEDIKKLVNASLEKFYKNDRDLIEMSNEEDMISEQCMVFHIGSYMKNKMNTLTKFQWADLDCEYNRNMNDPKMMRSDRKIIPDLVIHRRRSNRNNLLVIEFKKKNAETYDKENDRNKLMYLTDQKEDFKYNFGLFVELGSHEVYVEVYQEVNLCPNLTVAENLFIGREPRNALGLIQWKKMNKMAQKIVDDLNIDIDVTVALENYSVALQQMVAIARAVDMDSKVLILDEPTSSLDDSEVEKLFKMMLRLKKEGVGIVFVTHFLEQVYAVCDMITVLRNGELVGEYPVAELPRVELVAKMMGKNFDDLASIKEAESSVQDEIIIDAKGLGHKGKIKPFNLVIHKGEVIGLTGLLGSGRSELARVIYGADKSQSGTLKVKGKEAKINSPIDAMKLGMGFLPDDRKAEGVIADLSIRENMILAVQAKRGMFRLLPRSEQEKIADKYIKEIQVKTPSMEVPISQLSGGNQQKVILGRWLATNPDFLILDEPTRGIDIGTKTEIQKLIIKLAKEGKAVIFISSEIEEMLRTCDRMVVLRDGVKVGEIDDEMTQNSIMKAIAGGDKDE